MVGIAVAMLEVGTKLLEVAPTTSVDMKKILKEQESQRGTEIAGGGQTALYLSLLGIRYIVHFQHAYRS